MTRPMKNQKIVRQVRREVKAVLKLLPLIVASLLFATLLWHADLSATSGLFQSPPTGEPGSPTPEITPTEVTPEAPTATTEPTATLAPSDTPTLPPPTATETSTPVPTSFLATPTPDSSQRYPDEDSSFRFDFGALFDSTALAASYAWLCCGLCSLFLFPLLFVVLWIASVRRRNQEE